MFLYDPQRRRKLKVLIRALGAELSGCDDDPAGLVEPVDDALPCSLTVDVCLAHRGDQEDLVVHGEAVEDAGHDDRELGAVGFACGQPSKHVKNLKQILTNDPHGDTLGSYQSIDGGISVDS